METIRHLPLPALRHFYAVAKYGSLAAAAERLFVTPGAISKQIRLLETALGLPLCGPEVATGVACTKFTSTGVMWQTIIHCVFILSAVGIAWTDKLMSNGHSKQNGH